MQPKNDRPYNPLAPQRSSAPGINVAARSNGQDQAADITRGQIDAIYNNDPNATTPVEPVAQPQAQPQPVQQPEPAAAEPHKATGPHGAVHYQSTEAPNPYERTHDEQNHQINQGAWQKYHTAWQSYYQQYYERYYVGQVNQTQQVLQQQVAAQSATLTEGEAMYELRNDLIGKVKHQAQKVRKSRHFWPIISAAAVMLVFLFLQYNRVVFAEVAAYVSPGNVNPANIIVDPSDTSTITKDDRLIIPKINVDVPIIWTANAADQNSLNDAMTKGVAWFNIQQAHSRPGENGNLVLSGHSSNDWLDQGDYKFIFAPLEQMKVGDTFYVNYQQKRYIYKITTTKVVAPTDVASLATDGKKPVATLITCTPLGTALNRLLVIAEQISPDPAIAAQPTTTSDSSASQMPKNSPTFFERIFGLGN
mgnify:CR=1 FL=1